ncbi:hypothetical protein LS81_009405 [Helicobacter trogontum]|uniref:ATRX ADD domain-containing protein n=1 Tax=Helicobacter trogontum TaxID=50960 RepID=A0A4U8S4E4_9HELI|nr:hypothetical protein [Helicobacter trogontum]MCI5786630.1 hypothetical protein [Helicobacter trogontum]TLD80653.1 hypothetical protein LS81_009405 [Helicobacter trogontum]
MFLYKKCEICGTKINKLQNIWNIYTLKVGEIIQCSHCGTYYKTSKTIQALSSFYENLGLGIVLWVILGIFMNILIHTLHVDFNKNISFILSLMLSFLLLGFINCIIACIIPLYITQTPTHKRKKSLIYWLGILLLSIIALAFIAGFLEIFDKG